MAANERLKKIVLWLIGHGLVGSQKALSVALGYNPTFLSRVVSGDKPMSNKFIFNLVMRFPAVNADYIFGIKTKTRSLLNSGFAISSCMALLRQQQFKSNYFFNSMYSVYTIVACGFLVSTVCLIPFVPYFIKRNFRGTR